MTREPGLSECDVRTQLGALAELFCVRPLHIAGSLRACQRGRPRGERARAPNLARRAARAFPPRPPTVPIIRRSPWIAAEIRRFARTPSGRNDGDVPAVTAESRQSGRARR